MDESREKMGDQYEKHLEKITEKVNVRYGLEVALKPEAEQLDFKSPDFAVDRAILKMSLIEQMLRAEDIEALTDTQEEFEISSDFKTAVERDNYLDGVFSETDLRVDAEKEIARLIIE